MEGRTAKDALAYDRQHRRHLSRRLYAEKIGLTETRVHAIEHGRKLKPGELELLMPFIGDLLNPELAAATSDPDVTPDDNNPVPDQERAKADAERQEIGYKYLALFHRLGSRVPPYAWPSQFRLETAPPIEFPAIREWIDSVNIWLDEQDGAMATPDPLLLEEPEPEPPAPVPEPVPEPASIPEPPAVEEPPAAVLGDGEADEDEEDTEWETVAEAGSDDAVVAPLSILAPVPQFTSEAAPEGGPGVPNLAGDLWYLTNGERSTWLDCQRRWYLQSYRRLGLPTRQVTGAAAVGTRFHKALATWYQPDPGDPWTTFEVSVAEDREYLQDVGGSEAKLAQFEKEVNLVRAMLEGYFQWVQETGADVGLRVIAPEAVLETNPQFPGYPQVRLLAKIDVRVVDERDGSRWFVDHKSVGSFSDAIKGLPQNPQMMHYHLVEYLKLVEMGLTGETRIGGAIYNMARKVLRTAKAEPPFYQREKVTHNLPQLQAYWLQVLGTVEQIATARARLDAGQDHRQVTPPRPHKDCSWKCEFFHLCPMMDDDTARPEDLITEQLVTVNPLARYEPEAVGETL